MTIVVFVLAVLWALVLVDWLVRPRLKSPDSVGMFHRQISAVERMAPIGTRTYRSGPAAGGPVLPMRASSSSRAKKRRRDIFHGLILSMAGTLVLGFVPGLRMLWVLNGVLDGLFVAYVALLIRLRNVSAEREMKVRYLPGRRAPEPALLLRRYGN